jgi:hypothetical protein
MKQSVDDKKIGAKEVKVTASSVCYIGRQKGSTVN